jgi:predicted MFS family arabinose efflux permease
LQIASEVSVTTLHRNATAVALIAGAIFALGLGVRQSQALFIGPINTSTGIGYASISLAFAVGQLMWGVAMPVAGALAERWSARNVMLVGALLVAVATALTPLANSSATLIFLIGVLAACGAGAMGPGLIMSSVARWVPEAKRSFATGIVNAGGSAGQFLVIPLAGLLIGLAGWQPALVILGLVGLAAIPAILWITQADTTHATPSAVAPAQAGAQSSLKQAVSIAFRDPSFLLLTAGFFTCGFHVAFIATHLPGVVALCGLPTSVSAWSLAVIGLFNILGSLWVGKFVSARRMKTTLAGIYFARAVIILVFFFAPKTALTFLLFAAAIGFTYLSTVPPTIGLVIKFFGPRHVATLFGLVMLSHQMGGFLGAWLGGKAFEANGSYDWMWWADIALCLFAAAIHLPIREARPARGTAPAAA